MKTYQTYIFDLDGTITDTMSVWLGIFREGLLNFGIIPPDDKILSEYTHDWNELVGLGLPKEKVSDFSRFAYKLANERLPKAPLHIGALKMLSSLKNQNKRIAIFSTLDRPIFEPAMQHRNLYQFAEVAIAGTDVPHRKPHPDGILKALDDLAVPKANYYSVVYIGDKDTDIQAAHNAGVDGILYYPPSHQQIYDLNVFKKYKPEYIINNWQELLTI